MNDVIVSVSLYCDITGMLCAIHGSPVCLDSYFVVWWLTFISVISLTSSFEQGFHPCVNGCSAEMEINVCVCVIGCCERYLLSESIHIVSLQLSCYALLC